MGNIYDQFDPIDEPEVKAPNVFDQFDDELNHDFNAMNMIGNFPGSAANVGREIATAVMNPVDTAKGLMGLLESVGNKFGRVVGNKLGAMISDDYVPQPVQGEEGADAAWDMLVERYGGVEQIQRTIEEDPAGFLLDLSVVGAGPITTVTTAGKVTGPMARAAWQSGAKLPTAKGRNPTQTRRQNVSTALEQQLMPTEKGVARLESKISDLNAQVDKIIQAGEDAGVTVPISQVLANLDDLRRSKSGMRLEAPGDLQVIDQIREGFLEHARNLGKTEFTAAELQAFKQDIYSKINYDAKRQVADPIREEARKTVARSAKEELNRILPELADLNRQLGELYQLQPDLARVTNRISNRNTIGLTAPLNIAAGGGMGTLLGGGTGGVIGTTIGVIAAAANNPRVITRAGLLIDRLKKGNLGVEWLNKNAHLDEVALILSLMGQQEEEQ
jgi:hypothetical protein